LAHQGQIGYDEDQFVVTYVGGVGAASAWPPRSLHIHGHQGFNRL